MLFIRVRFLVGKYSFELDRARNRRVRERNDDAQVEFQIAFWRAQMRQLAELEWTMQRVLFVLGHSEYDAKRVSVEISRDNGFIFWKNVQNIDITFYVSYFFENILYSLPTVIGTYVSAAEVTMDSVSSE